MDLQSHKGLLNIVMIEARLPSVAPRKTSDSGGGKGAAAEALLPLSGGAAAGPTENNPADCHGDVESCHDGAWEPCVQS